MTFSNGCITFATPYLDGKCNHDKTYSEYRSPGNEVTYCFYCDKILVIQPIGGCKLC